MCEYTQSKQARFDKSAISCGIVEMHHLPDATPIAAAFSMANHLYHKANPRPAAFVIWSDVVGLERLGRGELLAEFLIKAGVGGVFDPGKEINPRTGNSIRLWTFKPDHEKFRAWYTEQVMNRLGSE